MKAQAHKLHFKMFDDYCQMPYIINWNIRIPFNNIFKLLIYNSEVLVLTCFKREVSKI